ncbi:MAG: hypothetical protein GXY03_00105 [Solirubrobacterales bacterium]|nr:hypothetical protein [Solirubrobacterales bacterium]
MAPRLGRLALPISDELVAAIEGFDCVGDKRADDDVARNVCDFLRTHRYRSGVEHGLTATYLMLDPETSPLLVGYVTLGLDKLRLTKGEMKKFGAELEFSDFGAIRIQMIGVDCRVQEGGYGKALLRYVTERARRVSTAVPARFLLADANIREVDWYRRRGFVPNLSERARSRDPERTVSMRLDLELPPVASEDELAA